jgi:hypothetical protein
MRGGVCAGVLEGEQAGAGLQARLPLCMMQLCLDASLVSIAAALLPCAGYAYMSTAVLCTFRK